MKILKDTSIHEKYMEPFAKNIVKIAQARDEELRKGAAVIKKRNMVLEGELKAMKKQWVLGKLQGEVYNEYELEYGI